MTEIITYDLSIEGNKSNVNLVTDTLPKGVLETIIVGIDNASVGVNILIDSKSGERIVIPSGGKNSSNWLKQLVSGHYKIQPEIMIKEGDLHINGINEDGSSQNIRLVFEIRTTPKPEANIMKQTLKEINEVKEIIRDSPSLSDVKR